MNTTEKGTNPLRLSNKIYDKLKVTTLVIIPALATLYFALGNVWGFEYVEEVLGTAVSIEVFLGALLGISTHKYKQERAERFETRLFVGPEGDVYLEFLDDPTELEDGEDLPVKVVMTQE